MARWRRALAERASVRGAVAEDYPELLRAFLLRKQSYVSTLLETQAAVA